MDTIHNIELKPRPLQTIKLPVGSTELSVHSCAQDAIPDITQPESVILSYKSATMANLIDRTVRIKTEEDTVSSTDGTLIGTVVIQETLALHVYIVPEAA